MRPTGNRLSGQLKTLNLKSSTTAATQLRAMRITPAEFAPAFREVAAKNPTQARQLAVAYDRTLDSDDALRQHFDLMARAKPAERTLLINAYRSDRRGKRVVQAVGLLPAAHGRVLMRDFLKMKAGKADRAMPRLGSRNRARPSAKNARKSPAPTPAMTRPSLSGWRKISSIR